MFKIKKIRVLIVDDSAMVRKMLSMELSKEPCIEVLDSAPDPYIARDKIVELKPDIVLLDIEMPRMDGITFLRKLMKYYPTRVIVVSSLAQSGGEVALAAIEYGAMDVLAKPSVSYSVSEMTDQLIDKIKEVSQIPMWRVEKIAKEKILDSGTSQKAFNEQKIKQSMIKTTNKIIAIGASTGGTGAIREILQRLPANTPPIVIAQHMPQHFTKSFAESLDKICNMKVKEAENNEILSVGKVLIAPGNYHLSIKRSGAVYYAKLNQEDRVFHQRPSVEVLFNSVAEVAGKNSIGVILTGMGRDGAQGLLNMKTAGAFTIAQDENTSVVFGMPKEAIDLGGVDRIKPLDFIAGEIISRL